MRVGLGCWVLLVASLVRPAAAEQPPAPPAALDAPSDEDFIATTERDEDPLGFDQDTDRGLRRAAAEYERAQQLARRKRQVRIRVGEVLSGVSGVHERRHHVELRWEAGLMFVRQESQLALTGRLRAEATVRLPLPPDAVVSAIRVCNSAGCRDAQPDAQARGEAYLEALHTRASQRPSLPILAASRIHDGRGDALALRLAPLTADSPLDLQVTYVARAPVRGGAVRFELPARGQDPRAARSTVHMEAPDLAELRLPTEVEAWGPISVRARLERRVRARSRVPCAGQVCTRAYHARPAEPIRAADVLLWLDASPSMEGPARGRLPMALLGMLELLPPESRVWPQAFAASVEALAPTTAGDVSLTATAAATEAALGASTQLAAAWRGARAARGQARRGRARILVLSDGRLPLDDATRATLRRARRARLPMWLIALDDGTPTLALQRALEETGGGIVHLGAPIARAFRQGDPAPLAEALRSALVARPAAGPAAGEENSVEGRSRGRVRARGELLGWQAWARRAEPAPHWWAFETGPRGSERTDGVDNYASPLAASAPHVSTPRAAREASTAMPRESVLDMLRTQLIPAARRCLRSDRKGRANYAVALTFHLTLEKREVNAARVEGEIPETLRACLEALPPRLTVPLFSGRIAVRYPIHTEREPEPPVIAVEPEVARAVDRTLRVLKARE